MEIVQVCVGGPRTVAFRGKSICTSIFKAPVEGRVEVGLLNISGDEQSDLSVHGGRDKAIYVYSFDYYADWAPLLNGNKIQDSQFGENLTVTACRDTEVVIGARYRFGDVEATVMQARIPCFKLGIRTNDDTFPNRFWQRGRLGFYLKVDKPGSVARGDSIELLSQPSHGFTLRKLYETVVSANIDDARNALEHLGDLDAGWIRRLNNVVKPS